EALRRATEEIEEEKAILKFGLRKDFADHSRFSVNNSFSLSDLYLRNILRIEWEKDWLKLSNQAELKTIQAKEKVIYQTDYFTNNFDLRLKARLSPTTTLRFRNDLEYTEYKERSIYAYDYYLNRTSLGLDTDISSGGFLHLSYQFSTRRVPDSTLIDYDRHFLDLSFDKYFGWETLLRLENELDRKTFSKPGGVDDFWEDRFTFGLSRKIHDRFELLFRNEFEVLSYDVEDEINFDYFENRFSAGLEYELSDGLEVAGEPEWVTFSSLKRDFQDYNYYQYAFSLSLDLSRSTQLWLSLEDKFGRRNYKSDQNPFYTDYLLNQISLFLDAELGSHLGFNLMLSVDSEWHDSKEDNLTVFLISSELIYSF
ncbi:MAG: hypothetical protein WBC88_04415, partial [Candidatus Zixiibacteriota bacterium]